MSSYSYLAGSEARAMFETDKAFKDVIEPAWAGLDEAYAFYQTHSDDMVDPEEFKKGWYAHEPG